jgi:hypothetical protein
MAIVAMEVVAVVMATAAIVITTEVTVAARVIQMILNPVHRPIIEMFYKMTLSSSLIVFNKSLIL